MESITLIERWPVAVFARGSILEGRMWAFWLGVGAAAVAYGVRGERIPGKIVSIRNVSDNSLRLSERIFWVASGIGAIAVGVLDFRARSLIA